MYGAQPAGGPSPSQPQMEPPSKPPAPPPQGPPQGPPPEVGQGGQGQDLQAARRIVMQAGEDLGPFMDNPEMAAQLQAALRLLTGQGGGPQTGGMPPR